MAQSRFQKLVSLLHFQDNLIFTELTQKKDKLQKIHPWLTLFSQACLRKLPEHNQCVDNITIPFKGCTFKATKHILGKGLGCNVVMKLTAALEDKGFFRIYADNFFTLYHVAESLLKRGIYYTATIRAGRFKQCTFPDEKQMKAEGHNTTASQVHTTGKFVVVKWCDNLCVTLLSSLTDVELKDMAKRWDRSKKEHILVPRASIVQIYNCNMVGVDLYDMLTSLCKYHIKSRRWYLYIFCHMITTAVVNSWLKYRENCKALSEKHVSLR
ncbi:piggyBac transposable element-derived protein 1-like [Schistocerca serialis cubense]|uniref:piggyBac transposable element-derived protein 1-like n=1 Tax=Schistocerca serialis cubense TaxID=2023355 RepID=UPI00214EA950|nr:piggyBac transposable element-derived protein 1-like [Schistocerca serialis cubense]